MEEEAETKEKLLTASEHSTFAFLCEKSFRSTWFLLYLHFLKNISLKKTLNAMIVIIVTIIFEQVF